MLKDAAFLLLVLVALLSSCTSTSTIQYDFDKPVHGQTTLQEKSGMIYITVKFPPTNKFGKQMSRKMDRNTAEDLRSSVSETTNITEGKMLNGRQSVESLKRWLDSLDLIT